MLSTMVLLAQTDCSPKNFITRKRRFGAGRGARAFRCRLWRQPLAEDVGIDDRLRATADTDAPGIKHGVPTSVLNCLLYVRRLRTPATRALASDSCATTASTIVFIVDPLFTPPSWLG